MSDLGAKFNALSPEKQSRAAQFIADFVAVAQAQKALDGKTDEEVADVLMKWCDELDITSPQSVLLEHAADRLRRAAGGPLDTLAEPPSEPKR